MSFPAYEFYRETKLDWIGDVPTDWDVLPLKRRFAIVGGSTPKSGEETLWNGDVKWATPSDLSKLDSLFISDTQRTITEQGLESCGTSLVPPETIVLSTRAPIGSLAIAEAPLCTNQGCKSLVPLEDVHSKYFAYGLSVSTEELNIRGKGTTFLELSGDELGAFQVPIPSPDEQKAISSFLDVETSKIDGLVSEQRRLIELLKEKRQAVISHAVTKGLNANAPMKPSGIQWLGDVPEHWEIERGRFLYHEREVPPEEGDGVVTSFRDGQVTLRTNRRTDGFTMAILEVGYQRVFTGDLVIHGMDAFAGSIGVSESTGKCTPEYAVLIPSRDGLNNNYFAKILRLMALRNYIYVICPSVRQRAPRFRYSSFKDVLLPVPPPEEQAAIMDHIASETAKFDSLEAEAERAVELLKERRTALISAAVTGKIDVRNFAAQGAK